MKGCADRQMREIEHAVTMAWQVERFNRIGKTLKPMSHYLAELRPRKQQTAAEALAVFQSLAAAGVPVKIRKVERDGG